MTRISLLKTAHDIVREYLRPGDIAVDATLGNGHDTVFLAELVGDEGRVFGFDVQAQALENTQQRLERQNLQTRVALCHASHAEMLKFIPLNLHGVIRAIMFNLGYLPGADKAMITQTASTLAALDAACCLLAKKAVITVLAYPGHPGGDQETRELASWCARLDRQRFRVETILSNHDQPSAPRLFVIRNSADLL
ncbi:MAG: class I SAM-dependent methyltransferase [Methylomonas sp.]